MARSMSPTLTLGVAVWLAVAGLTAAQQQDSDLLDEVRQKRQVGAQALEQEVRDVLAEADRLQRIDPARAVERLKKLQARLKADQALPEARRASLLSTVQERLKRAEEAEARATVDALRSGNQGANAPRSPREETIRRGLAEIRALRQQGRLAEANRLAENLARRFPDDPTLQQLRQTTAYGEATREADRVRAERRRNEGAALRDVEKSASPIAGEVTYSKDFFERTKDRQPAGAPKLTKAERDILRALDEVTTERIEFKNEGLEQVIAYLRKLVGQPITVNKTALDELNLSYESTVTATLPKGITKRSALKRILADLDLTYIVKNGTIEITSVQRAKREVTVRYYPIDDLVGIVGFDPGGVQTQQQVNRLIEMIQTTIEPDSWQQPDGSGGPGTIVYHAPTRTLIIKNTAEVHYMLGGAR